MAVNKVIYGTTVLVDLTEDTVTADKLVRGYTAHDKSGALIIGTADIDFVTYYVSSSEPTSSQGSDGDIWLVTD